MSAARPGVRDLTAAAAAAALALALGIISKSLPLPRLPYGGSITLDSLPILFIALWRGVRVGFSAGLITGLLKLLFDPHLYHPIQVLLDYPVPSALLGLAGLYSRAPWKGILLGQTTRFASHFISGVVFFASYAPAGMSVWRYSAYYNFFYIGPETLLSLILVPMLIRRIPSIQ